MQTLPDYLYYKMVGDSVIFYNKYRRPAVIPPVVNVPNVGDNPDGYLRVSWTRSMYNTATGGQAAYIQQQWRGYPDVTGTSPCDIFYHYIIQQYQAAWVHYNNNMGIKKETNIKANNMIMKKLSFTACLLILILGACKKTETLEAGSIVQACHTRCFIIRRKLDQSFMASNKGGSVIYCAIEP
jgi:hypothetical protein